MAAKPGVIAGGRTVLGWETTEAIMGRKFSKVMLMGPYWSGTNAVREEVLYRFKVTVQNKDKVDVSAHTAEAVQDLRDGLAKGPVLTKSISVGQQRIPRGYKLEAGSRRQRIPPRTNSFTTGQTQLPPLSEEKEDSSKSAPSSDAAFQELLSTLAPPVTLSFRPDTNGCCSWWKHSVRLKSMGEIDTDGDTLVIMIVKDPLFWLKSFSKHYYEMQLAESTQRKGLDALFSKLRHDGQDYRDAVELWSAGVASFLDDGIYPHSRCVLLRYEDFLFRFNDVMVHLSAFLDANIKRLKQPPNSNRSKHHGKLVRGRDEALSFYYSHAHRHSDFDPQHLARACEIDRSLLEALAYDAVPPSVDAQLAQYQPCCWVPPLTPGDIVATSFRCGDSGVAAGAEAFEGDSASNSSSLSEDRRPGRVWAQVVGTLEDGRVELELLRVVPRSWLVDNADDWAVVESPAPRYRGCVLDLNPAPLPKQTVPREWIDLRLPCPSIASSSTVPLTEEGYRAIVGLRSTREMAEFITRVVTNLEVNGSPGGSILDKRGLMGFARWFSGEEMVQSLAQIRRELPGKQVERWVTFMPPRPQRVIPAS